MIIGIVAKSSTVETLLNNLSEADFDPKDISVIMKDVKSRDAIAQDAGPFKGLATADLSKRLAQIGLSKQDIKIYGDAVTQGKVMIAIGCPKESEAAAGEMLKDASAEFVKAVGR